MKKHLIFLLSVILTLNYLNLAAQVNSNPNSAQLDLGYSFSNESNIPDFLRGKTMYGCKPGSGTYDGHVKIDIDDPKFPTVHSPFKATVRGGEFFENYYYCSDGNSNNYSIYKIDHTTGDAVTIAYHTASFYSLTYNYPKETMYALQLPAEIYSIDVTTGAISFVKTISNAPNLGFAAIACDMTGNIYGIELTFDQANAGFYSIDMNSGTCSFIGPTGYATREAQGLTFDRETGTLYWWQHSFIPPSTHEYNFCTIDINTGAATLHNSNLQNVRGIYFPFVENTERPDKPANFTVTPLGLQLAANLSWTNPTTTIAGEPLNNITKIVIERNGEVIKEIETTAVGISMNYIDNSVSATGKYYYKVYAVNNEGKGVSASEDANIGEWCNFRFVMTSVYYGGWVGGAIDISVNGTSLGKVSLKGSNNGEEIFSIPSDKILFSWISGETTGVTFQIYNSDNELIYEEAEEYTVTPGPFFEYENKCNDDNQECDPATNLVISTANTTVELTWNGAADSYSIMKNGIIINEVSETSYLDEEIEEGFYSYCIIANYSDGCASPLVCDDIMVLSVLDYKDNIMVYPNPANNVVHISGVDMVNVKVFNCMGQLVLIQHNTKTINVSELTNGLYILSMEVSTGNIIQKKIIINH